MRDMNDIKRDARDTGVDIKESWRRSDGESLEDKMKNLGDRAGNAVKDVEDRVHEGADPASREASYEQGRADEAIGRDEPA
ncbi:MAG TPA: hypothetical protein VF484_11155 [Candidatus Limnocylindrales bacterium]